jgi:hypothetical protein
MARPRILPSWATDANFTATEITDPHHGTPTKVEPSAGQKANGFEPRYRVPAQIINWVIANLTEWLGYFAPVPLANWTTRQADAGSSPTSVTAVASRAWAGERDAFMAILDAGANHIAQRSPAGDGWKDTGSGITGALFDVEWMGGSVNRWILVGAAGAIWYRAGNATDATAWSSTGPGSGDDFYAVAVNDDATLAVAVGENGRIYTSTDGATWTSRTSGTTADLLGVAYGGGIWVAVGNAAGDDFVLTSSNGTTWTSAGLGSASFNNVVYDAAHGVFVVTSGTSVYQVSTAGVLSTVVGTMPSDVTALATDGNGTIIAIDRTSLFVSTDAGETWSDHVVIAQGTGTTSTTLFYDATWSASLGCFVAVGTDDGAPLIAQSMRTR